MYGGSRSQAFGNDVIIGERDRDNNNMEPRLGLRLVRGPNWCWGDQDGGDGCVGTVVEVGEGGRSAMVQWDLGTRAQYQCGEDDKFDLRVFDAAPTG